MKKVFTMQHKNKKMENVRWETWKLQGRVPARENKESGAKAVFEEHFPESKAYILRFRKQISNWTKSLVYLQTTWLYI